MLSSNRILRLCLILICMLPGGCSPVSSPESEPANTTTPSAPANFSAATETPDPCTGWDCEISGIIYMGSVETGNELENVTVALSQHSWCSPTVGEHETVSAQDGRFTFPVFIHDTDTFKILIEKEGYQPIELYLSGFDCLYCSCSKIEFVLIAAEKP